MTAILAGLLLGTFGQLQQTALWPAAVYASLLVAGGLMGMLGRRWSGGPAMLAMALAAGLAAFGMTGWRAAAFAAQALPADWEGRDIALTGVIASMPQPGEFGSRFLFAVEKAEAEGVPAPAPPLVVLGWPGRFGAQAGDDEESRTTVVLRAGDRWHLNARLKAPHGSLNPHGHDAELWMWEQGIQATGAVRAGPGAATPRHLGRSPRFLLERARQSVRDALLARVPDPARGGVLAALAVGDQRAVASAQWDLFRATGVAHLMSISGLHVTMFAWGAAAVAGWGWRRSARLCQWWPAPHAALVAGVALAALYAAFSGGGLPAQRTVWMLACVGGLRLLGLRWPWPRVWALAAGVVVALDPWALLQPGFWLSFVAVAVLFATDAGVAGRGASRARALLREQAVVTVALAPLTLLLFGQVSVVGLVANLAAIPWTTLVVTPLALGGVLVPPLWTAGGWAVQGMVAVLQVLAAVPGAVLSAAAAPAWMGAAALAGGMLLVLRLPVPLRALGLPLLLPLVLWQPPRPAPGGFELVAADIGQGNAVLVRTATHSLLYDTGPRWGEDSNAGQAVLVPLLRALGERLDAVVVSHSDTDHIGGAQAVLAQHPRARLLSSIPADHPLSALRPPERCEAGQRWVWDGVTFEFLHPRAQDLAAAARKPNHGSCVLRVSAPPAARRGARQGEGEGEPGIEPPVVALLAGDIEAPQERRLVAQGAPLAADWLLVPHHGSKTSSTEAFLDAVGPRVAVVQAGYRNRYGHPAPPVLARYTQRGIAVADTPACGAATWASAAPARLRCERNEARRYWHHPP